MKTNYFVFGALSILVFFISLFFKIPQKVAWPLLAALGQEKKTVTILVGGDMMFDRNIRRIAEKNGYDWFFASTTSLFGSVDLVVANLEGPITTYDSKTYLANKTLTKSLQFTFDPQVANVLKRNHIDLVSLANNHTDNFGREGIAMTQKYLKDAGVEYFGHPANRGGQEKLFRKNNITIAFVGYHAFQGGFQNIIDDIKRLRANKDIDFIVVMPHWGEEYETVARPSQRSLAAKFVSAGADAVIGSHPHVIMNYEFLSGKPVFYSLGNLLFDQYFSAEVKRGNIVKIQLSKSGDETDIENISVYPTSNEPQQNIRMGSEKPII